MNGREERRATGIQRVPVQALVELCGIDPRQAPAFEAESIDVSGRGLHVRTGYVPELGTPLVCRFEEGGREIIAEGIVAWASTDSGGGEFGLMFTALDQGSVGALRDLTGLGLEDAPEAPSAEPAPPAEPAAVPATRAAAPPPEPPRNDPGARVRLHIEGLGAPMKALVRSGGRSRVKVGSTLEMLRVGRRLEIENLERNQRRAACIDAVEVMLDPQSGVPQLVVALHYDDVVDVTPDPTVIDAEDRLDAVATEASLSRSVAPAAERPARRAERLAEPVREAAEDDDEGVEFSDDEPLPPDEEVEAEAGRFQDRVTVTAQRAGDFMRRTGAALARVGGQAAVGFAHLAQDAGARVARSRAEAAVAKPRRTTAMPPSGVISADGRRLRPQHGRQPAASTPPPASPPKAAPAVVQQLMANRPVRRVAAGAGLLVIAVALGAYATRRSDPLAAAAGAAPSAAASMAAPVVPPVGAPGNPSGPAKLSAQPPASRDGIVADVPLFGPTPMATMEPAPLGPAPGEAAAPVGADEEVAVVKAAPMVEDETFDAPVKKGADTWGRGQVHLPTIHRLRLDAVATAIEGAPSATGFSIVLPGVKVMENGAAIARRDDRIAKVTVENTAAGAKITFRFRTEVPPYRVRLRKDFVEFLISAPK